MTETDGINLVNAAWPLDGPYTPESLISAARALAELYRYLAHATIGDAARALPNIPDAYPAFGVLMAAARSNQQVLQQVATRIDHLAEIDPTIRHDNGDDAEGNRAAVALIDAAEHLRGAANSAGQMAAALSHASGQLSHIYHEDAEMIDVETVKDGE